MAAILSQPQCVNSSTSSNTLSSMMTTWHESPFYILLASLVVAWVIKLTTSNANNDDKVDSMANLSFQCLGLTHLALVTHICVSELGHHWFRQQLVACSVPNHYLNQCWFIVNWTPGNKFQWNLNLNFILFIQENAKCCLPKWRPFCPGGDELRCFQFT